MSFKHPVSRKPSQKQGRAKTRPQRRRDRIRMEVVARRRTEKGARIKVEGVSRREQARSREGQTDRIAQRHLPVRPMFRFRPW